MEFVASTDFVRDEPVDDVQAALPDFRVALIRGVYLRSVQILLAHSKIGNTIRCFGVDIDNVLTLAERMEI